MTNKSKKILSEISPGELLDKMTILEIKLNKIKDKEKLLEINKEYEYVPNDIVIGCKNDSGRTINGALIFGVNSSGKSSYMKQLGTNIVLCQAGFFCAAKSVDFYPFHHIFTRISGNDNLFKGHSSFTVEMLELRDILKRCNEYSIVLADELAKGSEICSSTSIVASGIVHIIKRRGNFVFATHLHGLTDISEIKNLKNVQAYHLKVEYNREKDILVYNRKLQKGRGSTLNGLEVCRSMDMDKNFLYLANKIRKRLIGLDENLIVDKKSIYNKNLYMGKCEICGSKKKLETHHLKEQRLSDENNFIGHIHQNDKHNIVCLCNECHSNILMKMVS